MKTYNVNQNGINEINKFLSENMKDYQGAYSSEQLQAEISRIEETAQENEAQNGYFELSGCESGTGNPVRCDLDGAEYFDIEEIEEDDE